MSETTLGADVSVWQDDSSTPQHVNFSKMRTGGAFFVFIKASQSTFLDRDFTLNWENAARAGCPRGAYHFLTWDASPYQQAVTFANLLKNNPPEIAPVLDYECRTGMTGKNQSEAAWTFISEVQSRLGKPVLLYTSPSYWQEFGSTNPKWLSQKLWIANYYQETPHLPAPFTEWEFWQFSLGKGQGLSFGCESLDIDLDYYNGSLEKLYHTYGIGTPPPEPPPPTPTPAQAIIQVENLRVRDFPAIPASDTVAYLRDGTSVTILEEKEIPDGSMYKVRLEGWIAHRYLGQEYARPA